jgi:hypothetical protein
MEQTTSLIFWGNNFISLYELQLDLVLNTCIQKPTIGPKTFGLTVDPQLYCFRSTS